MRTSRLALLAAGLTVLAGGAAAGIAPAVAAASPASAAAARAAQRPGPAALIPSSGFSGVAVVSGQLAWAVGSRTIGTAPHSTDQPLIMRWNGTAWKQLPSPVGGDAVLSDVAVASARSAWAVGSRTTGTGPHSTDRPLILHWNGTHWKQVTRPAAANADLSGVAAVSARNAWVVGRTGSHGTLIEHWNGTAWQRVPSPSGPHSSLSAVTAVSARSAWAVGNSSSGGALIEHWDGTAWKLLRPGSQSPSLALSLSDVAASSARNAWVVGIDGADGISGLILHWNGTAWSKPRGGF